MLNFLTALLGPFLDKFFSTLLAAWNSSQERADLTSTHERAAVAEAANETLQTVQGVANDRESLKDVGSASAGAIVDELRHRAKLPPNGSGGQ